MPLCSLRFLLTLLLLTFTCLTQADAQQTPNSYPVQVEYTAFRPAKWEESALTEETNEKRNKGGLVFIYYTNTSDQPVSLREWYINERESGHYRLAGDVAWDRRYAQTLEPGQTTVQEICGVSDDFQTAKPATFRLIGGNWSDVARADMHFEQEKLRISSITMDASLTTLTIHLRSFLDRPVSISSLTVEGQTIRQIILTSPKLDSAGHIIATVHLENAMVPGDLAIVRCNYELDGRQGVVFSHRNAYADYIPNGTWGIEPQQYTDAHKHHLNTMVRGGSSTDAFFSRDYLSTGLRAMPHTGLLPNVDMLRDLEDHPAVACWYIHDEPDWLYTPQLVLASHAMTKQFSAKKPTLITLCRNVKFFEYGFIPDIPCHDHYSVTAPTSSKWPYKYGTRLEETGYYTADLKYASEPKPIWAWTQGVHLWDERPKLPLPSPDELGAQLYFNLGRGAKGNLWFTFLEEAGQRYPDTKQALQQYSRIVRVLENDLLLSDPYHTKIIAPPGIDVAPLITPDRLIVFVCNTNYTIRDTAYLWTKARNVSISIKVPTWFEAADGFVLDPAKGIGELAWEGTQNTLSIHLPDIHMGTVLIFTREKKGASSYRNAFRQRISIEQSPIIIQK